MKLIALNTDNKIKNAFSKNEGITPIFVESVDDAFINHPLSLTQAVFVCSQENIYQKIRSYSVFTPVLMYKLKKIDPLTASFNRFIDLENKAAEVLAKALYAKTHMVNEVSIKNDKLTRLFLNAPTLENYLDQMFLHFSQILEVENITWISDIAVEEISHNSNNLKVSHCYRYDPGLHLRDLQASKNKEIINRINKSDYFNKKENFVYSVNGCGKIVFTTSSSWITSTYKCVTDAMDMIFAPLLTQHFQIKKFEAKAHIDNLTGLFNHRFLNKVLKNLTTRPDKPKFATLFMDLDYFKKVNDSHGHLMGSKTLISFSRELFSFLKDSGLGFRYGGDEFVVLLENFTLDQATDFAETFRQKIESMTFALEKEKIKLTVSIGIAIYPEHAKTPDKILEIADQAMYFGKHKSRNITYIAS